jgi:hypothetical protein
MKPSLKLIHLLILVIIAGTPGAVGAGSAEGRITGRIRSQSGDGLVGALVTIFGQENGRTGTSFTHSDRSGAYVLANLTPGSYRLQVIQAGFAPVSASEIHVDAGRTTSLDVVLDEFVDFISNNTDPRNWDVKSVMRSASNRRLVFRDLQGGIPGETEKQPFSRGGAMMVASGTDLITQNFPSSPGRGQTSILSNFAFTEPVSDHSRMIFSGQLSSGYDAFWQLRNTYNYRPGPERDLRFSLGYRRLVFNEWGSESIGPPFQFLNQDADLRDSGIQTVAAGLEGSNKILDLFTLEYGVDVTRIYCGGVKNYFSPNLRLTFTPGEGWALKGSLVSKRSTEYNSLSLPGGEVLNLSEPISIARINRDIRVGQLRHAELSVGRTLRDDTSVEVAVYQDRVLGAGPTFLVAGAGGDESGAQVMQLPGDQSAQRGLRVVVNRKLLDFLTGSIAYGYGTGTRASVPADSVPTEVLISDLLNYMRRSYYHIVTSEVKAQFPRTKTNLTTMVKWYAGDPVTSLDLFADRLDAMTKGVNFLVRQVLPLPEFMGNGHWEASVDLRNMFDQGFNRIRARDGDLILTRNPRSLRFGLNLNFF